MGRMSTTPSLRWYQFSLRTLLLTTLLLGCALAPIVHYRRKSRNESLARNAVVRLGGTVYTYYVPRRRARWTEAILGDDSWGHIDLVDFRYREVTNADIRHLEAFAELIELRLDNALVTDTGLKRLRGLKHLRYLTISDTFITESACNELQRSLPDLKITIVRSEIPTQSAP